MQKTLIAAVTLAALFAGSAIAQTPPPAGPDRFFAVADANHDGSVSRAEFDAAGAARFAQMDANHDGVIGVDERPPMPAGANGPPPGPVDRAAFDARGAQMFDHMDGDHNGTITQAEADAMHAQMSGGHH